MAASAQRKPTPTTTCWTKLCPSAAYPSQARRPVRAAGGGQLYHFLQIDGINGGSTVPGYVGWFEISAHDLDVLTKVTFGGPGDIQTSLPTFSSLTVDLDLGSSLALLYQAVAEGRIINSLQIEGAVLNPDTFKYQSVYELRLANVRLTGLDEGSDGSTA